MTPSKPHLMAEADQRQCLEELCAVSFDAPLAAKHTMHTVSADLGAVCPLELKTVRVSINCGRNPEEEEEEISQNL